MRAKVAIVIVTYNGSEFFEDLFSSLEKIDYPKNYFEIIFVDNNSDKQCVEELKKFSKKHEYVKVFFNKENTGFVGGNVKGYLYAQEKKFDFIYLLNQDTEVDSHFLQRSVRTAEENKNAAAVQSRLMYHDKRDMINSIGGIIHFLGYGFTRGNLQKIIKYPFLSDDFPIMFPSGAGVLLRMSSLNKIGFFSEDFFSYYEDADLGWRIWLLGYECMLSSGSVVYHKYDFSRSTKSYFYMERNRYIMIFQNYKIRTLFFLSPALFLMEIFTLARSFMNRYWIVRLKMYNYFLDLENWKKILYNKKVIFAQRVASDKEIFAKMSGKISYQESAGVLILYIVNPFLSLYYRLVLKILIW